MNRICQDREIAARFEAVDVYRHQEAFAVEMVEGHAEKNPTAIAVVDEKRQLSYAELNRYANQVAHYLKRQGVGPEVRVGICMERSVEMIIWLFGIMKAGGAYVPLDPSYPAKRLRYMLEDSEATVLATEERVLTGVALRDHSRILSRDKEWESIGNESSYNLDIAICEQNLAYVIYTSGSTGKPKGVAVPHSGLINLVRWHLDQYGISGKDRVSQVASPGFDAAVWEIWGTLCAGASLHILNDRMRLAIGQIPKWIETHNITVSFMPTPLAEAVLEERWSENVQLRKLLTGGDRLHALPQQKYGFSVVNHYGPTESTVVATAAAVDGKANDVPPIGKPIANTLAHLLDEQYEQVALGVAGELYIGGASLARGYLNRADLTAEKFVPNPYSETAGERLYRTGDLVRWRDDGKLEYLGRTDHQVKISGYRIELEEIEKTLESHPAVKQAIVVAQEDQAGTRHLVGYVVKKGAEEGGKTEQNREVVGSKLQEYLRARLPEYMVPTVWMELDTFPLSPNGKIDRASLSASELDYRDSSVLSLGPRTELEHRLVEIWQNILGVKNLGVNDNFFDLGGQSLSAGRVLSRLAREYRIDLPVHSLFESPTIATFASRIQSAMEHSKRLHPVKVGRTEEANHFTPVSYFQEMLWLFHQLHPLSACYNVSQALQIYGDLDIPALQFALNEVVRRHEPLRTRFVLKDGEPMQFADLSASVCLSPVDLAVMDQSQRAGRASELIEHNAQEPFDVGIGPMVRALLLHLAQKEYLFVLTIHHIATDGWSQGILWRELGILYNSFRKRNSSLPDLPMRYADFALWQRSPSNQWDLYEELAYWRNQLKDVSPVLNLPTDRKRSAIQSFRGAKEKIELDASLVSSLKKICAHEKATLFMILLAAFKVLLYRYTGQPDVVVGAPAAGRHLLETEALIGFFVNILPLRTDLTGNPSFDLVLRHVSAVALDAYRHQHLPFQALVKELGLGRDLASNPIFQVMFVLQNTPPEGPEFDGLRVAVTTIDTKTSILDLTVCLTEQAGGLTGYLEYDTDLFEQGTICRWIANYRTLLQATIANPQEKIGDLSLLTVAERVQLLEEWNRTEAKYEEKSVQQLIEEQVRRTPNAIAVVCGDREIRYEELNRQANQLARYLREQGVGPEVRVGICMERSVEMIVGLLGILKAGGAYVPLDPNYPVERRQFMVEDAGPAVVLAEEKTRKQVELGYGGRMLCWEQERERIGQEKEEDLGVRVEGENLAYLIYTSGSTGRPKAVGIRHKSVRELLGWAEEEYREEEVAGVLASTSICFDLSVFEIFVPLSRGGRVLLVENALELRAMGRREGVTLVNTVPSAMGELVRMKAIPGSVRVVNLAGEALSAGLVKEIYEQGNVERVMNLYGPSEDTTYSTYEWIKRGKGEVTIGRGIANTQVYVLEDGYGVMPVGVWGELYLGGAGLGRGYLNRAELTAERFVPNPYSRAGGERLYRTGDVVRWREDGRLEYQGRKDDQVKVRGYRIELGEIEKALESHAGVKQAVVQVREDESGMKSLVGYVVRKGVEAEGGGASDEASSWRTYLRERLPEHMVPSSWVELKSFPLGPNGKIDRKQLPQPNANEVNGKYEAPRNAAEEALCSLWREILNRPRVGIHEDFFELGGHSLLATKIISRLPAMFGIELPVRVLFQAPTVAKLAVRLEEHKAQCPEAETGRLASLQKQLSTEQMLASLETLSDEEIELLLNTGQTE